MRFAFKTAPQNTTWADMLAVWREADDIELFESGWTRLGKETGGDFRFGYNFHYCNIDKAKDPNLLACSAFEQGLRLFDIRDVYKPKEIAYFNNGGDGTRQPGGWGAVYSAYAAAMPQFDPVNHEIWYTDHDQGFYVVKPTNGTWITDITEETVSHGV